MATEFETQRTDAQGRLDLFGPLALLALLLCMIAAHLSLLHVPYFWDETYFAPAARDLFQTGKLIPVSVPVESHPPLVYLWLAIWWKLFGFSIVVARSAMLAVAALTLAAVYRLARLFTAGAVPIVVTALTAIYPVFFAQSTLVQLDMAAAALTLWGLVAYLQGRYWASGLFFSLATLSKETAIVAPAAVLALEILLSIRHRGRSIQAAIRSALRTQYPLLLPLLSLLSWFVWLRHASGSALGDPYYVNDNFHNALHPIRIALAFFQHLWHLLGYMNLIVLTGLAAVIWATRPSPAADSATTQNTRAWLMLAVVIVGHVLTLSIVGRETQARYLLPLYPLVILASLAVISSRVSWWPAIAGLMVVVLAAALFPHTKRFLFRREDNLAYVDYVRLHQAAVEVIPDGYPPKLLTVYPVSKEMSEPWFGYTKQHLEILEIESFTREKMISAQQEHPQYLLMFPRGVCKEENPLLRAHWWHKDYFRGTEELTTNEVAELVNARVIYRAQRGCDWVAVLKVDGPDLAPQGQSPH